MLKRLTILVSALAFFILQSQSALAYDSLVTPNDSIRLTQTTTLVS